MAAPLIGAALKLAAKQIGKNAAASSSKGGGGMEPQTKMILAAIVIFAMIFTGAVVQGVSKLAASFIPQNPSLCDVPKVGDKGDSDPANSSSPGGGSADGSLGSNIPYPDTNTEKVVYPLANANITSGYGYRQVPAGSRDFFGTGTYFHNGLDFAHPLGTPIFAAADGIVAQSAPNNEGYGYGTVVTIHHLIGGEKYNTTYGHVLPSSLKFKVGDTVKAGDVIAGVGSEGNSTGAHLHFVVTKGIYTIQSEINKGPANNIDPVPWFASQGAQQTTGTVGTGGTGPSSADTLAKKCEKMEVSDGTIRAWGGHSNGAIPESEMKTLSFNSAFKLEKEAATNLEALNIKYKAKFGTDIPVASAYKDSTDQGRFKNQIAGWAKSVELSPAVTFASEEYKWLSSNGMSNGWMNPLVNRQNGSSPLANRWVFVGVPSNNGGDLPANINEYQKYAGERLQSVGISSPGELSCLIKLWERESNWRVDAINPAFSPRQPATPEYQAYGIVQAAPGSKMASAGADWVTNPKTQINWGIGYIQERYVTPCGAWNHSEAVNWY